MRRCLGRVIRHTPQRQVGKDGPAQPVLPRQGVITLFFQGFKRADQVRNGLRRTGTTDKAGNLTAVLGIEAE